MDRSEPNAQADDPLRPARDNAADPQPARRTHDPERTRQDILDVATEEFATLGFSGARVDAIAERTRTTKRMIYYYFGGKEGLYLAVLEQVYRNLRAAEQALDVSHEPPGEALRRLIELTFDYQEAHPEFVRLVNAENVNNGRYLVQSEAIQDLNVTAIDILTSILQRGQNDGVFRSDVDPIDVHMLISAFCFFRVSNRYTFGAVFQRDLSAATVRDRHKRMIAEVVIGWLADGTGARPAPFRPHAPG
jgi:AcrR family transcriptional regulator